MVTSDNHGTLGRAVICGYVDTHDYKFTILLPQTTYTTPLSSKLDVSSVSGVGIVWLENITSCLRRLYLLYFRKYRYNFRKTAFSSLKFFFLNNDVANKDCICCLWSTNKINITLKELVWITDCFFMSQSCTNKHTHLHTNFAFVILVWFSEILYSVTDKLG